LTSCGGGVIIIIEGGGRVAEQSLEQLNVKIKELTIRLEALESGKVLPKWMDEQYKKDAYVAYGTRVLFPAPWSY